MNRLEIPVEIPFDDFIKLDGPSAVLSITPEQKKTSADSVLGNLQEYPGADRKMNGETDDRTDEPTVAQSVQNNDTNDTADSAKTEEPHSVANTDSSGTKLSGNDVDDFRKKEDTSEKEKKAKVETPAPFRFTPTTLHANIMNLWRRSVFDVSNHFGCVELEGRYVQGSSKEYSGQYYDFLEDVENGESRRVTLIVPSGIRGRFRSGKTYIVSGVMDAAPDSSKSGNGYSWKTLFRASAIVGESTPEVSPEQRAIEAKKSELLAKKMRDEYYDVAGFIRDCVYEGKPFSIHILYGETAITDQDVHRGFGNVISLHEITLTESRTNFMRPESIVEALRTAPKNADIVAFVRGGGSGLEVFDSVMVAEAILGCDALTVCAIGHAVDHVFAEKMCDRAFTTPTDFGDFLLRTVEGAIEQRDGSKAKLMEDVKKPFEERISFLEKTKTNLEAERTELDRKFREATAKIEEKTKEADLVRGEMTKLCESYEQRSKTSEEKQGTQYASLQAELQSEKSNVVSISKRMELLQEKIDRFRTERMAWLFFGFCAVIAGVVIGKLAF